MQKKEKISEILFENVKILYNEETAGRKQCRKESIKENIIITILTIISTLVWIIASIGISSLFKSKYIQLMIFTITTLVMALMVVGIVMIINKIQARSPADLIFMQRIFTITKMLAVKNDNKINLIVTYKNGNTSRYNGINKLFMDLKDAKIRVKNNTIKEQNDQISITIDTTRHEKFLVTINNLL